MFKHIVNIHTSLALMEVAAVPTGERNTQSLAVEFI